MKDSPLTPPQPPVMPPPSLGLIPRVVVVRWRGTPLSPTLPLPIPLQLPTTIERRREEEMCWEEGGEERGPIQMPSHHLPPWMLGTEGDHPPCGIGWWGWWGGTRMMRRRKRKNWEMKMTSSRVPSHRTAWRTHWRTHPQLLSRPHWMWGRWWWGIITSRKRETARSELYKIYHVKIKHHPFWKIGKLWLMCYLSRSHHSLCLEYMKGWDWRCLSPSPPSSIPAHSHFHLNCWINIDRCNLLHNGRLGLQIQQPLVDSHLPSIPGVGPLSTRTLSASNPQFLSG